MPTDTAPLSLLKSMRRWAAFLAVMAGSAALLSITSASAQTETSLTTISTHWSSLLPPIFAVVAALCFRSIIFALLGAFFLGAVLQFGADPRDFIPGAAVEYLWYNLSASFSLYTFGFLFVLIGMIHICTRSGGIAGLIELFTRFAKSSRSARLTTAASGFVIFFDDYVNCVVGGQTMRPLTDRWKIPREKLAYIIDSTTAPVAGVAVISTWIAFEISLLSAAAMTIGLQKGGYSLFIEMLPYRFYCWGTLMFVIINSLLMRDFGPMLRAEIRAAEFFATLPASNTGTKQESSPRASFAVIPLALVAAGILIGMLITSSRVLASQGERIDLSSVSGWQSAFGAMVYNPENPDGAGVMGILFWAATAGALAAFILPWAGGKLRPSQAARAFAKAFPTLRMAIFILTMAWSMKTICQNLGTDQFLLALVNDHVSIFWIPVLTFLLAAAMSFAMGSSWSTMGILLPVLLPFAWSLGQGHEQGYLIFIMSAAAVLDGAIFGDHCSPISDTTVLSSAATQCDHLSHVETQLIYALCAMLMAATLGYLAVAHAWIPNSLFFLLFPIATTALFLIAGKSICKKTLI